MNELLEAIRPFGLWVYIPVDQWHWQSTPKSMQLRKYTPLLRAKSVKKR